MAGDGRREGDRRRQRRARPETRSNYWADAGPWLREEDQMDARLMLPPRLERELAGLRKSFEDLVYVDSGQWVLLAAYCFPDLWSERAAPVAFQVPIGYPGTP